MAETPRKRAAKRDERLSHLSDNERDVLVRLGSRVNVLRTRGGTVSISALAAAAGLDESYLGELERGRANPTMAVLSRLAHALNVPMAELVDL